MKRLQLAVFALAACGVAFADGVRKLSVDKDTCFLLGTKGGAAADLSGRISNIEAKGKASVTLRRYYADPELVKTVLTAKADDRETDTAKWMTKSAENRSVE